MLFVMSSKRQAPKFCTYTRNKWAADRLSLQQSKITCRRCCPLVDELKPMRPSGQQVPTRSCRGVIQSNWNVVPQIELRSSPRKEEVQSRSVFAKQNTKLDIGFSFKTTFKRYLVTLGRSVVLRFFWSEPKYNAFIFFGPVEFIFT